MSNSKRQLRGSVARSAETQLLRGTDADLDDDDVEEPKRQKKTSKKARQKAKTPSEVKPADAITEAVFSVVEALERGDLDTAVVRVRECQEIVKAVERRAVYALEFATELRESARPVRHGIEGVPARRPAGIVSSSYPNGLLGRMGIRQEDLL